MIYEDYIYSFDQCFQDEQEMIIELDNAIETINHGEDFAFYNLHLNINNQKLLSDTKILQFDDIGFDSSIDNLRYLKHQVITSLKKMKGLQTPDLTKLSDLIVRITNAVLTKFYDTKNFELRIRIRPPYNSDEDCFFWHLDKSQNEVLGIFDDDKEIRFIIPLIGSGTVYKKITQQQRSDFMKIATDNIHYYGHGLVGCEIDDEISTLLNSNEIKEAQPGYGSVHIAGSKGAMHAAPKKSGHRLILLITPTLVSL